MAGSDQPAYSASAFASKTERGRGQASGGIAGQNEVKWQVSSSSGFCNVGKTGAFNGSAVLRLSHGSILTMFTHTRPSSDRRDTAMSPSDFLRGFPYQARGLGLYLVSPCDLAYPVDGNV